MNSLAYSLVLGTIVCSVALGQADMKAAPSGKDTKFMKTLAQGGMAEVAAGRTAVKNASDPAVKQFAQQMVDDHTKNNDELKALAKSDGVALPAATDSKHQSAQKKLQGESGAEFDTDYIKGQVADHEKTVALLEEEVHAGQDAAVRDFAKETLPVVNHHLAMAKQLQDKLANRVAKRAGE